MFQDGSITNENVDEDGYTRGAEAFRSDGASVLLLSSTQELNVVLERFKDNSPVYISRRQTLVTMIDNYQADSHNSTLPNMEGVLSITTPTCLSLDYFEASGVREGLGTKLKVINLLWNRKKVLIMCICGPATPAMDMIVHLVLEFGYDTIRTGR